MSTRPLAWAPAARRAHPLTRFQRPRPGHRPIWAGDGPRKPTLPAAPNGPVGRDDKLARLEAILFLGREPLSSRKLAQLASLADGTEARTLVGRLNGFYDAAGTAFRIEELAGGFQLLTRPRFGPWLRRLQPAPAEVRLSGPALETLAVVAYRQPVVRAEVEAIRGVQCGEMLRQLMERDLVRIVGRAPDLGRPFLYGTSKRFLQVFGLRHVDDLPRAEVLRAIKPAGETDAGPAVEPIDTKTSDQGGSGRPGLEINRQEGEESAVTQTALLELSRAARRPAAPLTEEEEHELNGPAELAAIDDEDELEDEDLDEDDEDDDYDDEDDLEDDEWEEVDDEEDEDDEDDEDDDWEDEEDEDDEEWEEVDDEDDDDWDDDDDEDEAWEEEEDED